MFYFAVFARSVLFIATQSVQCVFVFRQWNPRSLHSNNTPKGLEDTMCCSILLLFRQGQKPQNLCLNNGSNNVIQRFWQIIVAEFHGEKYKMLRQ